MIENKMLKGLKEKLNQYNEIKFTYQPVARLTSWFPLAFSPISGLIMANILSFFFITYILASNPDYSAIDAMDKNKAGAYVFIWLFGTISLFSYLWSALIIYPLSALMKHKNGRGYVFLSCLIATLIALGIGYKLGQNSNTVSKYFIPSVIWVVGVFNTYSFKFLNEIMKRDVNGKIVYADNTTDKKPIISSEIKQLFKDYFQQKMSKKKSQDEK